MWPLARHQPATDIVFACCASEKARLGSSSDPPSGSEPVSLPCSVILYSNSSLKIYGNNDTGLKRSKITTLELAKSILLTYPSMSPLAAALMRSQLDNDDGGRRCRSCIFVSWVPRTDSYI